MMREIHLGGRLGKQYGRVHRFDIATPAEAIRALEANHPGFMDTMLKLGREGYGYRVLHGKAFSKGVGDADELRQPCSGPIRISPQILGAKRGGLGQILMAVVLVAAAVYTGGLGTIASGGSGAGFAGMTAAQTTALSANLMSAGIVAGLGGVVQLLSPQQSTGSPQEAKTDPSYVFDGAINTMAQGHPVPVGYGELIVGSAVISAGIEVEETPIAPSGRNAPVYTNKNGEVVAYPPPTLVWDLNRGGWYLPNNEALLYDETAVTTPGAGWDSGDVVTVTKTNFRTADGRVPMLSDDPERWDIPAPTSLATVVKLGESEFQWRVFGSVPVTFNTTAKRWEVPLSWASDGEGVGGAPDGNGDGTGADG